MSHLAEGPPLADPNTESSVRVGAASIGSHLSQKEVRPSTQRKSADKSPPSCAFAFDEQLISLLLGQTIDLHIRFT